MNDLLRPLFNLLPGMWDRRWIGLITAWVVLLLGGVGVALYHERYMASARVYVDTQTLLKPLMQGLTVQPNIDDQVAMVARTLLSRPNLERLVRENHLVVDDGRPDATNRAVDQLFKNIKLNINARENLYSVSYVNPNPQVALDVVQDLVNMFLTSGIGGKQQDTQQALNFLDAQIADYGRQLSSAEQKLKDFKTAHPGYSGQANVDYYTRVNQASDQLSQMQGQLSAAIAARNAIAAQMRGESPTITVTSPYVAAPAAGGGHAAAVIPPDVLDIEQRIQTQRNRLDDLLQRYTNDYPDVITARQTLARLEAEKKARLKAAAEQPAQAAASPAAPSPATAMLSAANPAYQQLRVQLAQADANVASLQAQVAQAQSRLDQLRSQAGQMPELDQQYASLMRGYDVIRKSYDDLVARRQSAGLTQSVDASSQLAVFRIVDPPRVEQHPLFPSKPMLIALLVLFALVCGVVASFVVSQLMPTYHSPRQLREAIDRPVLGSISLLNSAQTAARQRRDHLNLAFSVAALVLIGIVWAIWAHLQRAFGA